MHKIAFCFCLLFSSCSVFVTDDYIAQQYNECKYDLICAEWIGNTITSDNGVFITKNNIVEGKFNVLIYKTENDLWYIWETNEQIFPI